MKRFRVTMLVPQVRVIEAPDIQAAHNHVSTMMQNQPVKEDNEPAVKVHSIIEVPPVEVIDFELGEDIE